jgi:sec-independent protein translocase protein TatA
MDNPEIWIILVIIGFLVFGAKRMPDAARGLGRSLRIFKAETKGLLTDENGPQQPPTIQGQIPASPPQPVYQAAPAPAQPAYQPAPAQPAYQPAPAQPVYQPAPPQPIHQQPVPAQPAPAAPWSADAPVPPVTPVPERHDAQ